MKKVPVWFLLLLAMLLPVRGAVAAAMLCPVGASGAQMELAMSGHAAGHAAVDAAMSHAHSGGHDHASGHGQAPDASSDGHPGHDHHAASDDCNACSAYCSLTPLVSDLPALVVTLDPTAVKFADFCAPPPSFVSGGQERPPRTI